MYIYIYIFIYIYVCIMTTVEQRCSELHGDYLSLSLSTRGIRPNSVYGVYIYTYIYIYIFICYPPPPPRLTYLCWGSKEHPIAMSHDFL